MTIEKKQDILLRSLNEFYSKDRNISKLYKILSKDSPISLRIIDYLCTNYAKHEAVVYYLRPSDTTPFNLYLQYRAQLKAYSKLQFDPFRRHNRISIKCNLAPNNQIETTVAQLNFFKWAFENKVIDYIENDSNKQKIEKHMTNKSSKNSQKDLNGKAKRHNIHVIITFK